MDNKINKTKRRRKRYLTGEDIDMFRERESQYQHDKKSPICDTDIDGA
ncbi:MAG: hypothetical protein WC201_01520 [Bacilli bacterium]